MPYLNNVWRISRRIVFVATVYFDSYGMRVIVDCLKLGVKVEVLSGMIIENIRLKLLSLRGKQSMNVKKVAEQWNIQWDYTLVVNDEDCS